MSLFDVGRPTGGAGGYSYAGKEALDRREQNLRINKSQAEFFDFMDAQKSRIAQYDLAEAKARSGQRVLPGAEQAVMTGNELKAKQNEKDIRQLPQVEGLENSKIQEEMRNIVRNTDKKQLADISKVWYASKEALTKGVPKEQVYKAAREEVLSLAQDKKRALKRFERFGVGNEYSDQAFANLLYMASYADHDKQLNDKEHLAQYELELQRLKNQGKAGSKPRDVSAKQYTPDELKKLAAKVSVQVPGFSNLEGAYDEDNKRYTKSQGAVISTIADLAEQATVLQRAGEDVLKGDIEFMAIDLLNMLPDTFIKDDFGMNTFKAYEFDGVARVAMQRVLEARMLYGQGGAGGKSPSFIDTWNAIKQEQVDAITSGPNN